MIAKLSDTSSWDLSHGTWLSGNVYH